MGINTETPQGTLHIRTNVDPNNTSTKKDVIIKEGNIGVGHIEPATKVDIQSELSKGFKMADTSQGQGKVLTSDANGIGTWQTPTIEVFNIPLRNFGISWTLNKQDAKDNNARKTPISVTLPPGRYMFTINIGFETIPSNKFDQNTNPKGEVFIRARFLEEGVVNSKNGDANTVHRWHRPAFQIYPKYLASTFYPNTTKGFLSGTLAIDNNGTAPKKYFLYLDNAASYGSGDIDRLVPESMTFMLDWNESFMYYQKLNFKLHQ